MEKKRKKKKRKVKGGFSFYNLAIVLCIIVIGISVYILFKHDDMIETSSGISVVDTKVKAGDSISEKDAKKAALKQFKSMNEKDLEESDLSCMKIQRDDGEYYYITTKNNTMEIRIIGGKITRVNSVVVQE